LHDEANKVCIFVLNQSIKVTNKMSGVPEVRIERSAFRFQQITLHTFGIFNYRHFS